ncbi:hypothetical protein [Bosea sp. TAF32]|uniref:hypothetical protein n=1 Tax=Bosea sp. TAF32 TaxID=3237482 RepID=UPI003F91DCF8
MLTAGIAQIIAPTARRSMLRRARSSAGPVWAWAGSPLRTINAPPIRLHRIVASSAIV